jgi:hypothetical protein
MYKHFQELEIGQKFTSWYLDADNNHILGTFKKTDFHHGTLCNNKVPAWFNANDLVKIEQ